MKALKILMVSPVPTHPPTAGNRARVLSLVRALQGFGHEVHFALASVAKPDLPAMRELFGDALHILRCREPDRVGGLVPRVQRRLFRLVGNEAAYTWSLDDFYDPALTPQIEELCTQHDFDAAFVEYVFMSKAFTAMPEGMVKILDTHDRFALRHEAFLQAGLAPQWFSTSVAEETAGFRRADYLLAIQEREAEKFASQLGDDGSRVIPVGHLLDGAMERVTPAASPSAVFLASGNAINIDGARYFIDHVLPLVLRQKPDFKFVLAGDVGDKFANAGSAVVRLGRVPQISDAFKMAAIAVNPVRVGTGLNIKMLEALACGAACISSKTGSRGLEQYSGIAFETVPDDDPAAMANAVLSLLEDPARIRQLGDAASLAAAAWNQQQLFRLGSVLSKISEK